MSNLQDVERFEHQVEDMYSILVNISSELVNIKVSSYPFFISSSDQYLSSIKSIASEKIFLNPV